MLKLFSDYKLDCNDLLIEFCNLYLEKNWDFRSEKIFRLSRSEPVLHQLESELIEKNLPPLRLVSIFCRGPFNKQIIHKDTFNNEGETCKTGFYIPIITEGSKLVWFDPNKGFKRMYTTSSVKNSNNKKTAVEVVVYGTDLPIIGEYPGINPVIINTSVPHRAESTDYPRAALSIRLTENIDFASLE